MSIFCFVTENSTVYQNSKDIMGRLCWRRRWVWHKTIVEMPDSLIRTAKEWRIRGRKRDSDDCRVYYQRRGKEGQGVNAILALVEGFFNTESTKIIRKIKRTLQKSIVDHAVAERQKWAKFGAEKGNKPGPDRATTTVGESVALKLTAGNKVILYLHVFILFYFIIPSLVF